MVDDIGQHAALAELCSGVAVRIVLLGMVDLADDSSSNQNDSNSTKSPDQNSPYDRAVGSGGRGSGGYSMDQHKDSFLRRMSSEYSSPPKNARSLHNDLYQLEQVCWGVVSEVWSMGRGRGQWGVINGA